MAKINSLFLLKSIFLLFVVSWGVSAQITSYPYVEDFESGTNGWTIEVPSTSPVTSWQLGIPSGTDINTAASGNNAWVTNLNGDYLPNENGWLQSPAFDFSSMISPYIQFKLFWECEYEYDGAVMQSSVDSGSSWQNIGFWRGPVVNWYTSNNISSGPGGQYEGWSGRILDNTAWGSGGWYTLNHNLSNLVGQSNVIFRIAFSSDNRNNFDGVGFDLVKIYDCNAGQDNNLFICVNDSSGLFSLDSLLDPNAASGGSWQSLSGLTILENNLVDLSEINATALYNFNYTVSESSNCQDVASIVINAQLIPNAGLDIEESICIDEDINLFSFLSNNTSLNGTWTSNDGLTIINESALFQPQISIENISNGSYSFTNNVSSPNCGSDSSILTLNITKQLSPGENGTFDCSTLTSENELFNALTGSPDPGGRWEPNEGDSSFGNDGVYRYIHDATSNCPEVSAEVTYTGGEPDPGISNEYFVQIENDDGERNLDAIINGSGKSSASAKISRSGRWRFSRGPRPAPSDDSGNVDFPNTGAGPDQAYEYIYTIENDCSEVFNYTVIINVVGWKQTNEESTIEICKEDTLSREQLFDSLTKDGLRDFDEIWKDSDNNTVTFPVGAGIYYYEDSNLNTAIVTVIEYDLPDAGPDRTISEFVTIGKQNLDNILDNDAKTSSSKAQNVFTRRWRSQRAPRRRNILVSDDGGVDFPNTGSGPEEEYVFIYTVENECGDIDEATITIYVEGGFDIAETGSITICDNEEISREDLFGALTTDGLRDFDSEWYFNDIDGGIVTFPVGAGIYFYEDFSFNTATVTVVEELPLSAGENGTYSCSTLSSTDELFAALNGNPDSGGRWEPNEGDSSFGNDGTYRYIHDATSNCTVVSSEVIFTSVNPDSGLSKEYFVEIENDDGERNLNTIINGSGKSSANAKISRSGRWRFWRGPRPAPSDDSANVDFPNTGAGPDQAYEYIFTFENDCAEVFTDTITFNVVGWARTNEKSILEICEEDILSKEQLFDSLTKDGLRDFDEIWKDSDDNTVTFPVGAGIYYYEDSSLNTANVTVVEEPQLSAGENGALEIIQGTELTENMLFNALESSPDPGGTWSPELVGAGTYTYTHSISEVCTETSATVEVTESALSTNEYSLSNVFIHPNPTKGVVLLKGNTANLDEIKVFSVSGRLLFIKKDELNNINLSTMPSGFYFIQISNKTQTKSFKIIKE
jgi:hypothetical protein